MNTDVRLLTSQRYPLQWIMAIGYLVMCAIGNGLPVACSEDWLRFRGPNGTGIAQRESKVPIHWSESKNLAWKAPLPGPGHSSPIVVGDFVFVTCWTGYATKTEKTVTLEDLERNLICLERQTGKQLWIRSVSATLPEDELKDGYATNGYASHTPVSDGNYVYCFFGKSGVHVYDLMGNPIWQKDVGQGSGASGWGSASSPILHEDLLIVTAAAESQSIIALDKANGNEVWRQTASMLDGTWSTPSLARVDDERVDLVIAVPSEIWGLNPKTGKLRWRCATWDADTAAESPIVSGDQIYLFGGLEGGGIGLRAGGQGDVGDSHVLWRGSVISRISTPVWYDNKIYYFNQGIVFRINAETGRFESRLRMDGGRNGQDFSSPLVIDGRLYGLTRRGDCYVVVLGKQMKQLAVNRLDSDDGVFQATPAVSDNQIFIRSNQFLYCVSED